jgi:acyl-CoA thioesterase I
MTKTILCFGDSITDANRDKSDPMSLGNGYVMMLSKRFHTHQVINRGISGNRTHDLVSRLFEVTQETPDIISILIGINDVWHKHAWQIETTTDTFKENMITILDHLKASLPKAQLILVSPFILPMGAYLPAMRLELDEEIQILEDLSKRYETPFVPLQSIFYEEMTKTSMASLTLDGVHPTDLGHQVIADHLESVIKDHLD